MAEHDQNPPAPEEQKLYHAMGGAEVVRECVEDLYQRVLADEELAPFFEHASMDRLRQKQAEFLSAMADGPVNYTGAELGEVHRGRGINVKHFSKFCGHFADALEARGVAPHVIDEILARLALYSDTITGSTTIDG